MLTFVVNIKTKTKGAGNGNVPKRQTMTTLYRNALDYWSIL